ncbi:MAG: branched-chain amino acid ABC transporter permease [Desulfobacterales bacterium CG23_combo_of_CG06-09_8_20_14_all_52_9]|nr:MAG: branched-chain amino acid ABC transporter permease [Desulfobacterales bacterium CG23_combo_of_CG06-09_8_20_14_all_52_9]
MDYLLHILVVALVYTVFALSLNLELGYTGLYNFGHVAFFGIGAYASALLSLAGFPVAFSMTAGMIMAGAAGALLAVPALRLSGDYFGVATLAFAEMIRLFFLNERWLTKGPMGLPGIPRPLGIPSGVSGLPLYFLLSALVAAAVFLFTCRIARSPFGRALKVVREDEYVAQALGKNVFSLKVQIVAVGSLIAGLAGALYGHYITYISPSDFTLNETILVLLCVVLGGRGTQWGPVVGAFLIIFFQEFIRFLPIPVDFGRVVAPIQGMVYGAVLVFLMLKHPEGIIPEYRI